MGELRCHPCNKHGLVCLLFERVQGGGGEVFYCGEIHSVTHSPYRHRQHCGFAKKKGKKKKKTFCWLSDKYTSEWGPYLTSTALTEVPTWLWQACLWQVVPTREVHLSLGYLLEKSTWQGSLLDRSTWQAYLNRLSLPNKYIRSTWQYTSDRESLPDKCTWLGSLPVTEIPTWQVHQWQRSVPGRYTSDRDPYMTGTPVTDPYLTGTPVTESLPDRYTSDRDPYLTSTSVTEIPIWQVHLWQTSIPDKYTCDRDPYLTDNVWQGGVPTWQVHLWHRSLLDRYTSDREGFLPNKYTCNRDPYLTSTPVAKIPTWQVYLWQGGVPTWQRSLPDRYTCDRDPYLTSTPLTGVPWGDEGLSIFVVAGVVITSLTHRAALARHLTGSLTPGGWTPVTLVSAHNLTWTNRDE